MTVPRTSRGPMASVVGSILAGAVSAALLALALRHPESLSIFLAYLTVLPLFVAGLGAGGLAALVASFTGTAGLYLTGPSNFAFMYAFIFAVPTIVLTMLALRLRPDVEPVAGQPAVQWFPEGRLLTALSIYPCLIFALLMGLLRGYPGGLLRLTTDAFKDVATQLMAQLPPADGDVIHAALDRLAQIAPALVGTTWICIFLVSMAVAQVVLQRQNWQLRPGFSLASLQVPGWLIYLVAATGLVGAFAPPPFDYFGTNLSLMLGLPFFFVGLAIVHCWAGRSKWPRLTLTVFYLVVALLVWLVLLIAALGIVDQWANFRQRQSSAKPLP